MPQGKKSRETRVKFLHENITNISRSSLENKKHHDGQMTCIKNSERKR